MDVWPYCRRKRTFGCLCDGWNATFPPFNIVCFPVDTLSVAVLKDVFEGANDAIREAGAVVAGGHSVDDPQFKFGLAVTGTVNPQRILSKVGLRLGDRLILTKAIGTGIVTTASKRMDDNPSHMRTAIESMMRLNRRASQVASGHDVGACTDVTGFGLIGHAAEMLCGGSLGLRIDVRRVPLLPGTLEYCRDGIVPGGLSRNRAFREDIVRIDDVEQSRVDVLYDPQTSGGLLVSVSKQDSESLLSTLRREGDESAEIVGEVVDTPQRITLV